MIIYTNASIFDSDADVLVNPVNCVGVMGAGLAKEFKRRFPDHFRLYKQQCNNGQLVVGHPLYSSVGTPDIISFPTKGHFNDKSVIADIEQGLSFFVKNMLYGFTFSFPKLGCGNGGLNWKLQVKPLFERYFEQIPNKVYVHE